MILILGRFQPLHNGHMRVIKKAFEEDQDLVVVIGSSKKKDEKDNPFSAEERQKMLEEIFRLEGISAKIFFAPDIAKDDRYVGHIAKITGISPGKVMTGNEVTADLFKRAGYEVTMTPRHFDLSSTKIREKIAAGQEWECFVPSRIADMLKDIGGEEKIKKLFKD